MLYQLTASPTIELHSENIMRLFVRDANGVPVANARIKVWAGPPPAGDPPYFTDDFPYRLTNPSGMLEYFAVAGTMPDTRDYWMQVLANDGTPQSDPIQFHFPEGSTIWIIATVQASGGTPPDSGGTPEPGQVQWDARLTTMHVSIAPVARLAPGQAYWKIIAAQYQNEVESGGNHNLYYTVVDERGIPVAGVPVVQDWEGRAPNDIPSPRFTDSNGTNNVALYSGPQGWDPNAGPGPYTGWVGDPDLNGNNNTGIPGERFVGAGLPMNRHVNYIVTWRRTTAGGTVLANSSVVGKLANAPAGTAVVLSGAATKTVTPDGSGNYSFTGLVAGTYAIAIGGVGVIQSNISLDGNNSVRVDYGFPAPPTPPTLTSSSQVTGVIQNAPAAAQLLLVSTAQSFSTSTDSSGRYAFTQLPVGTYALSLAGSGIINPSISLDGTNTVVFNYTVQPPAPAKQIFHYLLFGSPALSATRTNFILALDYVARFAPTVGFSLNEAKSAQNVTIVGTGAITSAEEQALLSAGCTVRHIAGADSYAVEQLLGQLITAANPFPSA